MLGGTFVLDYAYSAKEARLWVPDQVAGAYGDALACDRRAWVFLDQLVRVVDAALQTDSVNAGPHDLAGTPASTSAPHLDGVA